MIVYTDDFVDVEDALGYDNRVYKELDSFVSTELGL
jgi:hypothetical protein